VNQERVPVTASFGVAQLEPEETVEQVLDRADRAMYGAKNAGRNRVVCTPLESTQAITLTSLPAPRVSDAS
jgi:diguanylate cyclase (GGDEF)-like protein